jgi:hypothetical protein
MNMQENSKSIIGRIDRIDFPELDLYNIETKIDTGARSSAIHCHNIILVEKKKKLFVRFNLLDPTHSAYNEKEFTLPVSSVKRIKSSFGQSEDRYFVKTDIVVFDKIYKIELSLSNRASMTYPVLLGRKLLKNNFIVDVSKKDLSYSKKSAENNQEI